MKHTSVKMLALCALFVALTAAGAYIQIPTSVIPFTLQILFVLLAGILLGPKYGALSQLVYVLLGLAGVPILSGGGGPAYVLKPSFGFLLGYILGAAVVGLIARGSTNLLRLTLACTAGVAAIYAVGLPYMALILNVHLKLGRSAAFILQAGMLPFLPFDGLKVVLAVILARILLPVVRKLPG